MISRLQLGGAVFRARKACSDPENSSRDPLATCRLTAGTPRVPEEAEKMLSARCPGDFARARLFGDGFPREGDFLSEFGPRIAGRAHSMQDVLLRCPSSAGRRESLAADPGAHIVELLIHRRWSHEQDARSRFPQ